MPQPASSPSHWSSCPPSWSRSSWWTSGVGNRWWWESKLDLFLQICPKVAALLLPGASCFVAGALALEKVSRKNLWEKKQETQTKLLGYHLCSVRPLWQVLLWGGPDNSLHCHCRALPHVHQVGLCAIIIRVRFWTAKSSKKSAFFRTKKSAFAKKKCFRKCFF